AKIPVIHIDTPIYNNDVEDGNVYLRKVEESVESLLLMLKDYDLSQKLAEIKLVKAYQLVCKKGLKYPLLFLCYIISEEVKTTVDENLDIIA
ncbi:MAG: hypothetical protein ACK42Z_05545, partial [Candidatus Kapaibacteriota bacterium]